MKIIWICPELIYPVNSGGRVVMYNRIKYFHEKGHEIYLVCCVDSDEELKYKNDIEDICTEVILINRNKNKFKNLLLSLLMPYCMASRTSKRIQNTIYSTIKHNNIDLIFCEFPQMSKNITKKIKNTGVKCILSQHNIEFKTMESIAKCIDNPIKRMIYKFDSLRLKMREKNINNSNIFDKYVFLSEEDCKYFDENLNYRKKETFISPIGYSKDIKVSNIKNNNEINLVIVGKMSYIPNVDGVLWFYENIFPIIKSQVENVKLYIVGRDPINEIKKIENEDIIVTGEVDSVEKYYEIADLVIVPVLSGGGIKTKLIEAAAYKKPIIATSFAIKGTCFENKVDLVVEDNEVNFAKNCINIINNPEEYKYMTENCYTKFSENYAWENILKELEYRCSELSLK